MTQTVENKKVYVVNDISKDREVANHVRETFSLKKVSNLMIVPFGDNEGKAGGVLLLVLLDKYIMNEDGKRVNEKFDPIASPVTNRIFQQVFVHSLKFNGL